MSKHGDKQNKHNISGYLFSDELWERKLERLAYKQDQYMESDVTKLSLA